MSRRAASTHSLPGDHSPPQPAGHGTKGLTPQETAARESKARKVLERGVAGMVMVLGFVWIVYLGPVAVCVMVAAIQAAMFRELVAVRIKQAEEIELRRAMPFFRLIQWAWFGLALFYTTGDSVVAYMRDHFTFLYSETARHLIHLHKPATFAMYSGLFIISVLSLRKGQYKYQLNQYTWTVMTCVLVVFQMQAVVHVILSGLVWFIIPVSLSTINDTAAYFWGMMLGKRFVRKPLLELSPNKTWEGFIGGGITTIAFSFFLPKLFIWSTHFTCPGAEDCVPDEIFTTPEPLGAIYDNLFISFLVPLGISVSALLPECIAAIKVLPICVHAMHLGIFASLVAPFGGFLASAIKRAYGIKDFDNIIPGHGGVTDRMDCQLIMSLCAYVYLTSFIRTPTNINLVVSAFEQLSPADQVQALRLMSAQVEGVGLS